MAPPPRPCDEMIELFVNEHPLTVPFEKLRAPPAGRLPLAVLPLKTHPVTVGDDDVSKYIPPPTVAQEFPLKVHWFTVGLPAAAYSPPPAFEGLVLPFAFPPVTVNPSRTHVASTPLAVMTLYILSA